MRKIIKNSFLSDNRQTFQPGDIVPELSLQVLHLRLGLAVPGKVETAVLVEHEADPTGIHLVGIPEGGGGVELLLRHLHQQGAVGESQGQPANLGVQEGFRAVRLVHVGLQVRFLRELLSLARNRIVRGCYR